MNFNDLHQKLGRPKSQLALTHKAIKEEISLHTTQIADTGELVCIRVARVAALLHSMLTLDTRVPSRPTKDHHQNSSFSPSNGDHTPEWTIHLRATDECLISNSRFDVAHVG